ncbi:recombination regulator RecX [Calidifontibacillus oryziterrae]|uniref:recombination regulator RecX n=1 Tax=Calidifontibacillus oryziterrae TaxID=1191699 RepID=UPI0002F4FD14|nr:recombination regulator RecX [Calidifontibacillus oryziterrae]
MIKIVRITTQKNNAERFNIYIDRGNGEEYGFSVDQDVYIEFQLRKGNTYTEEELNKILHKDEIKKAFNLALHFLSFRMRSKKEIEDYLVGKSFEHDIISSVIVRLRKLNFVNDLEFATAFVRSRIGTSTKGPALIKQELYRKGVSEDTITEALKEFSEEKQLEIAGKFAEKNFGKNKNLSEYQIKKNMSQALFNKGFSQEIVQTAISQVKIATDDEQLEKAVTKQGEKALKKYSSKYEGWELKQKIKQFLYQRGFSSDDIEKFIHKIEMDEHEG